MDGQKFDRITRALVSSSGRRGFLKGVAGVLFGGAAAATVADDAEAACKSYGRSCAATSECCPGISCVNGACKCAAGTEKCTANGAVQCVTACPPNAQYMGSDCRCLCLSTGRPPVNGECPCPAGQISCDGACVDPSSDPNNCGGCNNVCQPGAADTCAGDPICRGGACYNIPRPAGYVCQAANGVCDLDDVCDGVSLVCPPTFRPSTFECRPVAGDCDLAEFCPGNGPDCPPDLFQPNTVQCRPGGIGANAVCDPPEFCPGNGPNCPANAFAQASTPCETGNLCTADTCNGQGLCTQGPDVVTPTCPAPTQCQESVTCTPATGLCTTIVNRSSGFSCETGNLCTADTCNGEGACVQGADVVTPTCTGDQCNDGVCNPDNGQCVPAPRTGQPCENPDLCINGGTCTDQGICTGGTPVDCSMLTDQCNVGTCNPDNGQCVQTPLTGNACENPDLCTTGGICSNGVCTGGTPVSCPPAGQCFAGVCDFNTGQCLQIPRTGQACDDGNACTTGSTCNAQGVCGGGTPIACDVCHLCNGGTCTPITGADPRCATTCCSGECCDNPLAVCNAQQVCDPPDTCAPVGQSCMTSGDCCNNQNGRECCNGICRNTNNDEDHCGACNDACPATATCVGGDCQCPAGCNLVGNTCVCGCSGCALPPNPGPVNVPATSEACVPTGIQMDQGECVTISATGTASFGPCCGSHGPDGDAGRACGADGYDCAALLAGIVGNPARALIGAGPTTFEAPVAGELCLVFNDNAGAYGNNTGSYTATFACP